MALAGTSQPSVHQVKSNWLIVQTRKEMCRLMHIIILEYSTTVERKEKIRKSSKHKWMCTNHKSFSCTNVGTHFQSQISSVCVFQYIGHFYPSPQPLPLTSNKSSPSPVCLITPTLLIDGLRERVESSAAELQVIKRSCHLPRGLLHPCNNSITHSFTSGNWTSTTQVMWYHL